jgi:transcriptional regulator with XRE-family HTH domain
MSTGVAAESGLKQQAGGRRNAVQATEDPAVAGSLEKARRRKEGALLRARLSAGMTQTQLAKAAGLSQVQISHLECGERRLNEDMLRRLGKALGLNPSSLLSDSPPDSWQEGFDAGVAAARRALEALSPTNEGFE